MGSFFVELRRRHIYRIGGIYVVVAWGITQVLDVLSQMFALPDWIAQPSLVVLTIGFPVVLIAAWTIVGAAKSSDTPAEQKKATITDWALIGAFAVVIVLIGYQRFFPASTETVIASAEQDSTEAIASDIVQGVANRLPNSIAVLPFDNASPDPDDAYFAVGVHEEIINQLSKLRSINVIARNSVMQYAGGDVPIPEIATQLNVETVMRGSVRYAGNEVRLTAQLIDGMTNLPVWTTEDQGDLSDIFAIQSDIAMSIANSLQAEFSITEQEAIETPPTDSPQAYELYLRALAVVREGINGNVNSRRSVVQEYLDTALTLDSDFALAHALKARVYQTSRTFDAVTEENWPNFKSEIDRLTQTNANMALALNPNLGQAHVALARMHIANAQGREAQQEAAEALRLSPNDSDVLWSYALMEYFVLGDIGSAISYFNRAIELDPKSRGPYQWLGYLLMFAGRNAEAVEALQTCFDSGVGSGAGCLRPMAMAEFARRENESALAALRRAELGQGFATYADIAHGYGLLGLPEDARRAFERVIEMSADRYIDPVVLAWAYMGIGDYDEALRLTNIAAENPDLLQYSLGSQFTRFNSWSDPRLEEPEWLEVRERLALIQ